MRTRTMCQSLRAFLLFPESEQAARYELRGAQENWSGHETRDLMFRLVDGGSFITDRSWRMSMLPNGKQIKFVSG